MSDARPSFVDALKAAEAGLAEDALRPASARRIWRRLSTRQAAGAASPWFRAGAFVAAVAAGALLCMAWLHWGYGEAVGGFEVSSRSPGFESTVAQGVVSVSGGEATLEDKALRLQVHVGQGARLKREAGGLRVVSGEASFVAQKRLPSEAPARVLVSGGAIEVIGTRFTVKQSGDSGELVLYEGVVRFVVSDGRIVSVLPGEAFRWPVPPEPPLQPPAPEGVGAGGADAGEELAAPPVVQVPSDDQPSRPQSAGDWSVHDRLLRARVVLEEVPELRAKGQGRQALFRIRNALAHDLPATTREQLSAWEAEILEEDLDQPEAACRQWREHLWLFPGGRYEERAKEEVAHGCR